MSGKGNAGNLPVFHFPPFLPPHALLLPSPPPRASTPQDNPILVFRCCRYALAELPRPRKALSSSSVAPAPARHDLALEQRRAARLTRESSLRTRSEAAALGIAPDRSYDSRRRNPMSPMASAVTFGSFPNTPMQPRRPVVRGQRSPLANRGMRGTERSRTPTTVTDPAASIRDFSAREATRRAERATRAGRTRASSESREISSEEEVTAELPQFMAPELVTSDLASVLNKVPNLASPLPSLSHADKKLSPEWLKCTYVGDYSKYQLDTQDYLRGARGVGHTYARIILERNSTLSQDARKRLHWFIENSTRGPKRGPKPISLL